MAALRETVELHAHRKRVHFHHAVAQRQAAELVFKTGRAQHRGQKIPHIIVRVKTDQARTEQTLDDFLAPRARQHPENFPGRKRDVQEKSDGHFRKFFAHQLRQQHQMIIVNPQHVVRAQRVHHRLAENAVDVPVFLPVLLLVMRQHRKIMEQRPDGLVAETEVKPVHAFFRQKKRAGFELLFAISPHRRLMFGRNTRAGPAHPQIIKPLRAVQRLAVEITPQPGRQPARAGFELRRAFLKRHRERQTV